LQAEEQSNPWSKCSSGAREKEILPENEEPSRKVAENE
jgi:hypothetical protein